MGVNEAEIQRILSFSEKKSAKMCLGVIPESEKSQQVPIHAPIYVKFGKKTISRVIQTLRFGHVTSKIHENP